MYNILVPLVWKIFQRYFSIICILIACILQYCLYIMIFIYNSIDSICFIITCRMVLFYARIPVCCKESNFKYAWGFYSIQRGSPCTHYFYRSTYHSSRVQQLKRPRHVHEVKLKCLSEVSIILGWWSFLSDQVWCIKPYYSRVKMSKLLLYSEVEGNKSNILYHTTLLINCAFM